MPTFAVPMRDRRGPVPPLHGNTGPTNPMQGILLSQSFRPVLGNNLPNTDSFQPFDAEMSSEDTSDQYGVSGQPTPDSHRGSSHTSYSPPVQSDSSLDGCHGVSDRRAETVQGPPYYSNPTEYQTFTAASSYATNNPTRNDLTMAEGWEVGTEHMENPLTDQHWAVLEGMGWPDGNTMTDGLDWRPIQTSPHEVSR